MSAALNEAGDSDLILRVSKDRDFEAFTLLSSRYLPFLNSIVCRARSDFLLPVNDDDDMMQEAMLGFYSAVLSFDCTKDCSFRTYAGVCVSNRLKNIVRNHRSSKNSVNTFSVSLDEAEAQADTSPGPEQIYENKENVAAVLNQIHISLSEFERDVLALYLSGYKRKQISERLSVEVKSVDNALQRVRKKLVSIQ